MAHAHKREIKELFPIIRRVSGATKEWMGLVGKASQHRVQFYEDARVLGQRVASYLADALTRGGTAAAVACPSHRASIERQLASAGLDVDALCAAERLVFIDARLLLESFMDGELPDRDRFRKHVTPYVTKLRATAEPVHVYGEMVDLLWQCGNRDAVLLLEQMWGELMAEQPFSLVCGYQLDAFSRDPDGFDRVCAKHDALTPDERHRILASTIDPDRAVSRLEHHARSLEIEIERSRHLEQQMHELLAVSTELAAATEREQVAKIVVERGRVAVGAVSAGIWMITPDGTELELIVLSESSAFHAKRFERISLTVDTPAARVVRTGESVFLSSPAEYAAQFPISYERMAALHQTYRAMAILPLRSGVHEIGVMVYSYTDEHPFTASGRTFKGLLARQCSLALDRVRLIDEERALRATAEQAAALEKQAREQANEATRAREEILSVVSHDLRNPVAAILMASSSLMHANAGDKTSRVHVSAERIQRQAERMARFLSDLVDFAGIEAGRINLRRREHTAEEIISAASEMFGPIALERGLKLETNIVADLPAIECDSDRAVQVMVNLVANAVKVTPKGGAVSIGAEPKNDDVVFYVRDTGPGIDAEELPNLFERHWRSKTTTYKGAGLGLSIARGIVDAHGGRIWAESRVGTGSTFYFSFN